MSDQQHPHIVLLADFIESLKLHGFSPGPDTYIRIHRLFNHWATKRSEGESYPLEKLKVQIRALVAHRQEQQEQFDQLFEAYVGKFEPVLEESNEQPGGSIEDARKKRDWMIWAIVACIIALQLVYAGWIWTQRGKISGQIVYEQQAYTNIIWIEDSTELFTHPFLNDKILEKQWEISYSLKDGSNVTDTISYQERKLVYEFPENVNPFYPTVNLRIRSTPAAKDTLISSLINLNPPFPIEFDYRPNKDSSLHITVKNIENRLPGLLRDDSESISSSTLVDSSLMTFKAYRAKTREEMNTLYTREMDIRIGVVGIDTMALSLDGRDTSDTWLDHRYAQLIPGAYPLEILAEQRWIDPSNDSVLYRSFITDSTTVVIEEPQLQLAKVPLPDIKLIKEDLSDVLKPLERDHTPWLMALGLLIIYFLGELLWLRFGHKPVIDSAEALKAPEWTPLLIDRPPVHLFRSRLFGQIARMLRQRRSIAAEELDIPASLAATIQQGGYTELEWISGQQTAQYLLLIERRSREDHLAFFFREMVEEFQQRDISVESYFFHPDRPDVFYRKWEESYKQLDVGQLAMIYGNYRLVVIGEGTNWMDTISGVLQEESNAFLAWRERAWMSTRPLEQWGWIEYELSRLFLLLPAHEEGFSYLIPQWTLELARIPFYVWPTLPSEVSVIAPPEDEEESLLVRLKEYLGEKGFIWLCCCAKYPELYWELTLEYGEMLEILEAGSVAKHNVTLSRLIRLSWFREGEMPKHIRLLLYDQLTEAYKKKVRAILIGILEASQNNEQTGSIAQARQQGLLAMYTFEHSERKKEDEDKLKDALGGNHPARLKDAISLKSLAEIRRNPLALILPASFYKYGIRFFGTKWWVRPGIALMGILLIVGVYVWKNIEQIMALEVQEPYPLERVILDSERDSARWENYQDWWAVHQVVEADTSLIFEMGSLAEDGDSIQVFERARLHDSTYALATYNRAAYQWMKGKTYYDDGSYEEAVTHWDECCQDTLWENGKYAKGLGMLMMDSLRDGLLHLLLVRGEFYQDTNQLSFYAHELPQSKDSVLYNLKTLEGVAEVINEETIEAEWYKMDMINAPIMKKISSPAFDKLADDLLYDETEQHSPIASALFFRTLSVDSISYTYYLIEHTKSAMRTLKKWLGVDSLLVSGNEATDEIDVPAQDTFPDIDTIEVVQDSLPSKMLSSDTIKIQGYVGWDIEQRIPVIGANISYLEQETQTDASGQFSISIPASALLNDLESSLAVRKTAFNPLDTQHPIDVNVQLDEATHSVKLVNPADTLIFLDTLSLSFAFNAPEMVFVPGGEFRLGKEEDESGSSR